MDETAPSGYDDGTVLEPCVVGLDLSLTKTGVAHASGDVGIFKPHESDRGVRRLALIRDAVLEVMPLHVELVVIEDYASGAHHRGLDIGELGGVIRLALWDAGIPYLLVNPMQLKKYACGTSKVDKYQVMQAAERRLGYKGHSDDESDALWLRAIGWALLGQPLATLPLHHTEVIDTLAKVMPESRHAPVVEP